MDRPGTGSVDMSAIAGLRSRPGWSPRPTSIDTQADSDDGLDRTAGAGPAWRSGRPVVRYQVRYRDHAGKVHTETRRRLVDAERRKAELELELANGSWLDPRRGEVRLAVWAAEWIETRHDLRVTTWARLRTTMARQVLPRFGTTPLVKITNAAGRAWVAEMLDAGLSAATARKAVFALRRSPVANRRIMFNPAADVPFAIRAGQDTALSVPDRGGAAGLRGA